VGKQTPAGATVSRRLAVQYTLVNRHWEGARSIIQRFAVTIDAAP
jgi:hypothetical protein